MKYDPYKQLKQLGHDLMFCDIIYQRPTKETGWHDYINIVYKDLDTEEKKVFTIQDPLYAGIAINFVRKFTSTSVNAFSMSSVV